MMQGDPRTGTILGTDGVYVKNGATVLTADTASVNKATGDVVADGHVRIETGALIWVGDHITYNMNTHVMTSEQFRAGMPPCLRRAGHWRATRPIKHTMPATRS